jgi:predicted NBD/HSP70 family sugar kinase
MVQTPAPGNSKSLSNKRNTLLQALHRKGSASRLQLARELRISNSHVCELIDQMLAEKLLHEKEMQERRGRRGVDVRIAPSYGHLLGFDMEAKRLRLVVTDFSGAVVWQSRRSLRAVRDRKALTDEIISFLRESIAEIKPKFNNLLGAGLAASGAIDAHEGTIIHYDMLPQANGLPLRQICSDELKVRCVIGNNIRAMTIAEWVGGAAKGLNNFVCVAVRSGIAAGIVINGRLHHGSHGFSGEIGHMVVPAGDDAKDWKNLQSLASETALNADIETKGFEMSDATARRAGELIGSQLASIAAVLDPEAIILGGEMLSPKGPVYQNAINTFRDTALSELVQKVQLLPAQLGPFSAAIGAAHRCLYDLYPVIATPV